MAARERYRAAISFFPARLERSTAPMIRTLIRRLLPLLLPIILKRIFRR
jgi:hypothetical protein